jgi:hypothetical protein
MFIVHDTKLIQAAEQRHARARLQPDLHSPEAARTQARSKRSRLFVLEPLSPENVNGTSHVAIDAATARPNENLLHWGHNATFNN